MKHTLVFLCILGLLAGCQMQVAEDNDVLVTVDKYSLRRSEIEQIIPKGTSQADSLLLAESFVKKWIKNVLVYEVAERNIGDKNEEINRLVDEYRRSLLRHRYQKDMMQTKLSSDIKEQEIAVYYEANQDKFKLDKNLIKGLFLKVPINAPGLDKVRKQYRLLDHESLEAIEKFSMQQAVIYDYFYDKWVDFDEILDKMPLNIQHTAQYLRTNKAIETQDSLYCYLLNIDEYVLTGDKAPYEYASSQIKELIVNSKKISFLKNFEEDLYTEALRKGKVIFNTKTND